MGFMPVFKTIVSTPRGNSFGGFNYSALTFTIPQRMADKGNLVLQLETIICWFAISFGIKI